MNKRQHTKMAKIHTKPNLQELEDMLASDDEFPSDFNDVFINIPGEADGCELDDIVFPWLKKKNVQGLQKNINDETGETTFSQMPFILNETDLNERTSCLSKGERVVAIKGVLSKPDIVSLKSIINARPGDGTVLWFVNFLMHKDLQAEYSFLRSCLVNGCIEENCTSTKNSTEINKHNFFLSTF